jgi:hypothetical protein
VWKAKKEPKSLEPGPLYIFYVPQSFGKDDMALTLKKLQLTLNEKDRYFGSALISEKFSNILMIIIVKNSAI